MVKFLCFLVCLVFVSCFEHYETTPSKQIDSPLRLDEGNFRTFEKRIHAAIISEEDFLIHSRGGRASTSLKLAEFITKNNITTVVNNECTSNCAEIILPFSSSIKFENDPIIGFHGNINSYKYFVENHADKNTIFCNWEYAIKIQDRLLEKQMNPHFWKEQMKRLKPNISFQYDSSTCPMREYNFENHMWLPTSKQLKELWGLRFTGNVCADDFQTCSKRVDLRWEKGKRIVIGDEVYTSKGR